MIVACCMFLCCHKHVLYGCCVPAGWVSISLIIKEVHVRHYGSSWFRLTCAMYHVFCEPILKEVPFVCCRLNQNKSVSAYDDLCYITSNRHIPPHHHPNALQHTSAWHFFMHDIMVDCWSAWHWWLSLRWRAGRMTYGPLQCAPICLGHWA